tara:strand:+ start:43 stop:1677 length:1635 start_codon:yes stop_codon:yes gene_type:complete
MSLENKKIFVTNALPYANGPIHIGHMVGYIQADIWSRFLRMQGHDVVFVCASDAHGTPIMLSAEDLGVEPEELASEYTRQHENDFKDFHVSFDNYHTTHSNENESLVKEIYKKLKENDCIRTEVIEQAYDEEEGMFLPDRYVRGICPKCNAPDQYGDNCEKCGATYKPTDLIDPISVLSGKAPSLKESEHYFMKLGMFESMLKKWIETIDIHSSVNSKLKEWFEVGLRDWDISRDDPYFGFLIPGEEKKYFYVWLDAPIGYFASLKNLSDNSDLEFEEYIYDDANTHMVHFIGKDIIYFHALFWPAVLDGAGLKKPDAIYVNGFLTVNGEKMSKSRGTFIKARTYLDHLDPEYLRYYFAYKSSSGIDDFDLDTEDFENRINADLIGKWINIASRSSKFIREHFENRLSKDIDQDLLKTFDLKADEIKAHYQNREFGQSMRKIMLLADKANQYLDQEKPWIMIKNEEEKEDVQRVCTNALNMFLKLSIMLKPVMPDVVDNVESFMNLSDLDWSNISDVIKDHEINDYENLLYRIREEDIERIIKK